MKRHMLLVSNLIVIFAIVSGFTGIVYKDTRAYQDLAEQQMENILSLSDADISNHIENSMTKPVMVSKTMANDEFLKDWLVAEQENSNEPAYMEQLYSYLSAYQEKYGYTTVFCISAETCNYYYQDGFNKTISESDEHDVWYYNFIKTGHEYDIQVDTNEVKDNLITIFVNFRVEDVSGDLLGVIGVGLQVDTLEDTIRSYEADYSLSVYVINVGGSDNSFTGNTDIFIRLDELAERTGIKDEIQLDKTPEPKMQWFTTNNERKCLITKYNENLGWYLILEKDTNSISRTFQQRIISNIIFMNVSLIACITVTTAVFVIYNRRVIKVENTDELTGLPNRKLFSSLYTAFIRKHRDEKKTLFMLDVDHFKNINDSYGHIFGNMILAMVGEDLRNRIGRNGVVTRWGGDEFLGMLAVRPEEAEQILKQYMEALRHKEEDERFRITVSIGMSEINTKLSMEQMIQKVDQALYTAKQNGRNRISTL